MLPKPWPPRPRIAKDGPALRDPQTQRNGHAIVSADDAKRIELKTVSQ
jgi:hypothetical protein